MRRLFEMRKHGFIALILVHQVIITNCVNEQPVPPAKRDVKDEILPPCQACKVLVSSFKNGMLKTSKSHFGGGDTAYEEEKLGDYANSETRLVEIQEQLCSEVNRSQNQCYKLAETWEAYLEEWWFKHKKDEPELHKWLCISKIKHCCPENHYGPECKPCAGFPDKVCSGNGKCKGSGTRKGNGDCSCNDGYTGPQCDSCAEGYYEAYKDAEKTLCSKCHAACEGGCTAAGPRACRRCAPGWVSDNAGCRDVDECLEGRPCRRNEFCINTEGSYRCLACDPACDGCDGDGPDMCRRCAGGHSLRDGLCRPDRAWTERTADITRYLTYLGLCVATCIIFQRNTIIASAIGVAVALYVSLSEYFINNHLNTNPEFDTTIIK